MPDKKAILNPKEIVKAADRRLDPIGLVILVAIYFLNKFTSINLAISFEEALLINIAAGALRSIWEEWKRSVNFNEKPKE